MTAGALARVGLVLASLTLAACGTATAEQVFGQLAEGSCEQQCDDAHARDGDLFTFNRCMERCREP